MAIKKPVTLLIDADLVAFKYASTNEQSFGFGEGKTEPLVTDIEEVKPQVRACLEGYLKTTKATDLIICLTATDNWRNRVLPSYKGNRASSYRPELLKPIKDFLAEEYPSYTKPTLEADDVMGILSTHPKLISGKKIIVSEDKDMKTIPGWLWNPAKDRKPWLVSKEVADYWHMLQTLTGDTVDGYKGCEGVGKETAKELIDNPYRLIPYEHTLKSGKRKGEIEIRYTKESTDNLWASIVSLYEYKGFTERDALVQARVARICRHTDYNFQTQEVILWNPPA
jgi:5'-3' exonuclease